MSDKNITILFVCTGNTCRSPMAEVLAKSIFENAKLTVSVRSAGVSAGDGYPASTNAVDSIKINEKLDLSTHKSSQISREMLESASVILTMTQAHLQVVKSIHPQANAFTLCEYAGEDGDVSDPFGGSLEVYNECAAQIKNLILACVGNISTSM